MRPSIYDIRRANAVAILNEKFEGVRARMAEAIGVQASYVTKILDPSAAGARNIERVVADRIEDAGHKPRNWLDSVHDDVEVSTSLVARDKAHASVIKKAMPTMGRVPVVSWVIAGQWAEIEDHFLPDEDYKWLETTEALTEREAVALQVEGDSMYDPDNPRSFPPGCFIVVKRPDMRQPTSGDFVVVRLENQKRATFKQLFYDGDRMVLKALNKAYAPLIVDELATLVGVVTERIQRERY